MKAKSMMAKVDPFLESLVHYDKENIHPNVITALDPYLKDKEFDPEFGELASRTAEALMTCGLLEGDQVEPVALLFFNHTRGFNHAPE